MFGVQYGSKYAKRCKDHRKSNDINCVSKRCEYKYCDILPTFGLQFGRKYAKRCKKHKNYNDIDCVNKCCQKCFKQPTFGTQYGSKYAKRCFDHKNDNDIDCTHKRCQKCSKQPTFGVQYGNKYGKRCFEHRLKTDVNVKMKPCKSCHLPHKGRYQKCCYCRPNTRKKTKELTVINYLKSINDLSDFVHDKSSADNTSICGKYRPDILYDCGTHFIIVEVDENAHQQYDSSCEIARMTTIQEGLGLKTIFIRYNPDCYKINGKIKKISQTKRLTLLEEKVRESFEIPEEYIKLIYLYYSKVENDQIKYEVYPK